MSEREATNLGIGLKQSLRRKAARISPLLLGQGTCSGKTFGKTFALALCTALMILYLAIFLMVSLLGRGTEPGHPYLLEAAMLGVASGFSLLLWVVLGQAIRRIRSTGQLFFGVFLVLAFPFPILVIPLGFALSLWPGKPGAESRQPPGPMSAIAVSLFALLLGVAVLGILCGIIAAIMLVSERPLSLY